MITSKYMMILLAVVIFGGNFNQAFAIQFEAAISPTLDQAKASFKGDKIITLRYPENSAISELLNGRKETVSFTLNSSDPNNGLTQILSSINNVLLQEKQSHVQFENATLVYRASINGGPDTSTISYQVELR
ncbi:MAG: hypothetical protein H0X50_09585, partial [Nitrosopumilus sp.]|nr:hypothetical protein [Nitrosopumilus sp.]